MSISPNTAFGSFGPGFLGPRYAPLVVGRGAYGPQQTDNLKVRNIDLPEGITPERSDTRRRMLSEFEDAFHATHPDTTIVSHRTAYERAAAMMQPKVAKLFDLTSEPDRVRDAYGRNSFGQGCLLARRLIEHGVPFVEISLNGVPGANTFGWDTHSNNFNTTKKLCSVLDWGWSSLMRDLRLRGLLDSTLVVWMGEFGRTPQINPSQGRDHFATAWTTVLGGGGVAGGQCVGRTSANGLEIKDRPVTIPDFLATLCLALGVDPMKQNMSNGDRPIRIVEPDAKPIKEALA